jgi:hypothetical protein
MTWTRGRRELAFSGRLPLEQGAIFEQAIWGACPMLCVRMTFGKERHVGYVRFGATGDP